MTRDEYIKSIIKELDCSGRAKKRIRSDLENDISMALGNGETMEEIIDRMGPPEEIAADFMDMTRETGTKKPYSKGISLLIGACVIFIAGFLMNLLLMKIVSPGGAEITFEESFYCMICWLVLMIILIVIEILTLGLTTIWFAGGSLVALILAVLSVDPTMQVFAFCLVSAALLFLTRPVAMKYFNKTRTKTNAESLVGKIAVVTQDIDNISGAGEAVVGGMIWTARSASDAQRFMKGETVEIVRISGAKLIVKQNVRR